MKLCPTFKTECGTPLTCCNGCYANPVEQTNSDNSCPHTHYISLPRWLSYIVCAGLIFGLVYGAIRSA